MSNEEMFVILNNIMGEFQRYEKAKVLDKKYRFAIEQIIENYKLLEEENQKLSSLPCFNYDSYKNDDNIKLLEDYIKLINKGYCEDCNELCNIHGAPAFPSKAIENLIEENKELSKLLEEKTMRIEFENIENYIPKSKVKEKIEAYNKMINATYNDPSSYADNRRLECFEIRKVLLELLEEGE